MTTKDLITYEQLVDLLDYNKDTGIFTWKVRLGPRALVGNVAGSVDKTTGYTNIRLGGKAYKAHRLAWLWCMQKWPDKMIDHINGIRDDNRLDNLREASSQENQQNRSKQVNNTSGFKGVSWNNSKNKYIAQITLDGKVTHLGYFLTAEVASQAYETAATQHFKEFKRENTIHC